MAPKRTLKNAATAVVTTPATPTKSNAGKKRSKFPILDNNDLK